MNGCNTEKEWVRNELVCIVTTHPFLFHRCGYVEVPTGHPMHGKDYGEAPDEWHAAVNGGLTFAGSIEGRYFVGFDCAHLWDAPDRTLVKTSEDKVRFYRYCRHEFDGHVWTLPEVEAHVNALADLIGGE